VDGVDVVLLGERDEQGDVKVGGGRGELDGVRGVDSV
jgi:hypothetical protein